MPQRVVLGLGFTTMTNTSSESGKPRSAVLQRLTHSLSLSIYLPRLQCSRENGLTLTTIFFRSQKGFFHHDGDRTSFYSFAHCYFCGGFHGGENDRWRRVEYIPSRSRKYLDSFPSQGRKDRSRHGCPWNSHICRPSRYPKIL
jgi:hypothetical protein